mgnify:CR=1 FL=1
MPPQPVPRIPVHVGNIIPPIFVALNSDAILGRCQCGSGIPRKRDVRIVYPVPVNVLLKAKYNETSHISLKMSHHLSVDVVEYSALPWKKSKFDFYRDLHREFYGKKIKLCQQN